jgi:oxygen-dependent protoporphyrinogen oxidase
VDRVASVVVVGGGIAGLAAAYAIRRDAPAGTTVTVVDSAARVGGKLRTSEVAGVAVDEGAEAFLTRAPEAIRLAADVGLGEQIVHPATSAATLAIDGTRRPVPARTVMGVPTDVDALADVLTPAGLERARRDLAEPGEPVTEDVAVGAIVAERLGREVVDRVVDPLLGGVYAGRAELLSLQATVPGLAHQLVTRGSLIEAARAAAVAAPRSSGPVFGTVRGGLGKLAESVAAASKAQIRTGETVREVHRTENGFRLVCGPVPYPTALDAEALVVAVPAAPAARMLRTVAPNASAELSTVDYASIAIVTLAYPSSVELPAGSGMLVPAVEGRTVKGLTFCGQKWPHLAGGPVLVRASVGRYRDTAVLQRDDAELAALAAADVRALTGVEAAPIEHRVTRWGGALPQYAPGHPERVRRALDAVAAVPGLAVAGAAYAGVGVPACIRTGYDAAARICAYLSGERQSAHG